MRAGRREKRRVENREESGMWKGDAEKNPEEPSI